MTSRCRLVLGILLSLTAPGACADFESGLQAFQDKSYGPAHDIWQECAKAGSASCQYGLGVIFDEGLGVEADTFKALIWYEKAAQRGQPDALMQLGFLYATGRGGVIQDPVRAWAWFARAAALGLPGAAGHRDRIGRVLSMDELARAERLADEASIHYHLQK